MPLAETTMFPNLRTHVRNRLQRALASWGYQLQRITPLDLRSSEFSPREILLKHEATLRQNLLVDVPISRCRSSIGTALDERHPFVTVLVEGPPGTYEESLLEAYYEQCQPAAAVEVLGVEESAAPGFIGLPALASVNPWSHYDPRELQYKRGEWMEKQAIMYNYDLSIMDGYNHFGPVSTKKGHLEIRRLRELHDSISQNGFIRSNEQDGDLEGQILTESGGDWCILINSGQHRSAVAAALGFSSVPVRISKPPVMREGVMYWPQVLAGRITHEGALTVFDRIMRGDPPPSCHLPRRNSPC